MKYELSEFEKNGVSWPLSINQNFNLGELEKKYFLFQEQAVKIFGKKQSLKPYLLSTFFDKISHQDEILKNVKSIIGENIYLWSSAFFCKEPKGGKIVSYHQDNPYWQLTTDKVVTVWIALTESNKNSGALELFPKSHKLGLISNLDVKNPRESYLKGEKTTKDNDLLSYKQDLNIFLKKNKPQIVELSPGEYSIHHVNTVHGSGINKSDKYRIGYALRYISSSTKHSEEKKDRAMHIHGEKNSYFIDEKRPKSDFDENSIIEFNKSMNSTGAFGNKKY